MLKLVPVIILLFNIWCVYSQGCVKGIHYCLECNDLAGTCKKCISDEYFPDESDAKCSTTKNCKLSDKGQCFSCKKYYYLDKNDNYTCKDNLVDGFMYCLETEDGIGCDKCSKGYYLSEDKKCTSINHCSIVGSNNYLCEKCEKGYFLSNYGRACNVNEHCMEEDQETEKCIRCEYDSYLDTRYGICLSNQKDNEFKNCEKGEEHCESCIRYTETYYLGEDFKCSTSKNCSKSEDSKCVKCSKNYYLGAKDNKCTKINHCVYSKDFETCLECQEGYYFDKSDSTCKEETKHGSAFKNCKIVDKNYCAECRDNFYLNGTDNKCYDNSLEGDLYKCSMTNYKGNTCTKCEKNYYLGSVDKKCSLIYGCAKSETINRCSVCQNDYCLDPKKGTCRNSDWISSDNDIFYKCIVINEEGTKCKKCKEGYVLTNKGLCYDTLLCAERKNGECLKCKERVRDPDEIPPYYSYCLNSNYGCIEGYDLSEGCLKCDNYDFSKCTQCLKGYRFGKFDYCYPCKKGCGTCTNDEDCGSCDDGYYEIKKATNEDSYDVKCEKCSEGCKICENEKECKECFRGYFLTNEKSDKGNIECEKCDYGCAICDSYKNCLECEDGYDEISYGDYTYCERWRDY